ncbi:hypothetical protein [Micromonospora cremea]|nr:hypothetical protein [Micromonospora cremea]
MVRPPKSVEVQLDLTREHLSAHAGLLATACGVPDLRAAVPSPPTA